MTTPSETAVLHHVPYDARWESADLVSAIIGREIDAADDPLWQKSGADSAEEYAFWSWRLCGVAGLRMALGPGPLAGYGAHRPLAGRRLCRRRGVRTPRGPASTA